MDQSSTTHSFDTPIAKGSLPQVVIDLEKLRHINCGLGRFSLYLGQELLRIAADRYEPVFFLPRSGEPHFRNISCAKYDTIRVRPWRKEGVQRWLRPIGRYLPGIQRPALWHVTNQMSRYLPLDDRVPVVLTIHDLNFLYSDTEANDSQRVRRKLADIQRRVDRAAAIVTDSHYVADDLRRHIKIGCTPVHVVPLGLNPIPAAATSRPSWLPPGAFAFSVGNFLPHKNFRVLVALAKYLPNLRVVIAGKKDTVYGAAIEQDIRLHGLSDRVFLPGIVSDAERQWLYEQCSVFLFPSLTEGFGFPVLEAMQCGKPVVMSRRTSLPEIAGDHGFFFDSYEPEAMASVIEAARQCFDTDPEAASRYRQHAKGFSWRAAAEGYVRVYNQTLHEVTARDRHAR